jgi:hypothetical protein
MARLPKRGWDDRLWSRLGASSIRIDSDSALKSLVLSMISSEKSATFRDHALGGIVRAAAEHSPPNCAFLAVAGKPDRPVVVTLS